MNKFKFVPYLELNSEALETIQQLNCAVVTSSQLIFLF